MEEYLEKAYDKHVPAPVREYIASREVPKSARTNRPSRSASSAQMRNNSMDGNP